MERAGAQGWFVPRCVSFLVLKAQLGLRLDELELSSSDLQHVLFLLEPGSGERPPTRSAAQPRPEPPGPAPGSPV